MKRSGGGGNLKQALRSSLSKYIRRDTGTMGGFLKFKYTRNPRVS